jgi:hypothetical protein
MFGFDAGVNIMAGSIVNADPRQIICSDYHKPFISGLNENTSKITCWTLLMVACFLWILKKKVLVISGPRMIPFIEVIVTTFGFINIWLKELSLVLVYLY